MKTTIYIDALFLLNFTVNLFLLKITDAFSKEKNSNLRLVISSLVASIYAVCVFLENFNFLYNFGYKIIMSLVMVIIANKKLPLLRLLKIWAIFFLVSFSFAGILLVISFFSKSQSFTFQSSVFYFDISAKSIILTAVICYVLIKIASTVFMKSKVMGIKSIKIVLGQNECNLLGFSDTGNMLKDPLTSSSVVIVETERLSPLFPNGIPKIENVSDNTPLRVIPFSSLGNSSDLMIGFKPDKIYIDSKPLKNIIVALSDTKLSSKSEYEALFNPEILNL